MTRAPTASKQIGIARATQLLLEPTFACGVPSWAGCAACLHRPGLRRSFKGMQPLLVIQSQKFSIALVQGLKVLPREHRV